MMNRPSKISLSCFCALIVIAAVCFFYFHEPEPSYNGKTLSEWLDVCAWRPGTNGGVYRMTPEQSKAVRAVKAVDTNAIPFLVRWMNSDNGRGRIKFLKRAQTNFSFLRPVTARLERNVETERQRAATGFSLLRERAATA